jgi:hypothetical protein
MSESTKRQCDRALRAPLLHEARAEGLQPAGGRQLRQPQGRQGGVGEQRAWEKQVLSASWGSSGYEGT